MQLAAMWSWSRCKIWKKRSQVFKAVECGLPQRDLPTLTRHPKLAAHSLVEKVWNVVLLCLFLIIFYWLCYYSCPDFSSFALFHPATPTHSGNPSHHCLCPWVMHISSLATPFLTLYFTSPCLFCIYLFAHLFCCCFVLFYFILFLPICTS